MKRGPPGSTRTDTLFPLTTHFRFGKDNVITFRANAIVDIAPKVYSRHRIESDVTVRGVASADLSPDGSNIIFSALSHLFMTTCEDEDPDLLTDQDAGPFQPVYAPNGKSIAFVTWKDYDGGNFWRVDEHENGRA